MVRFKIVTTGYNCADYLEQCLQSLEDQTYKNYEACIVDDSSTDPRQREIIETFCGRNNWKAIFNRENRKGMATMIQAIDALNCEDEDVIVILDGDDWLYSDQVLEHVKRIYIQRDVLLTYGNHVRASDGTLGLGNPSQRSGGGKNLYRKLPWLFTHLRTFKYLLWRHIQDEDLRDRNGDYFRSATDMATMYPMAEMAGKRVTFIPEVLYVYNDLNPLNDFKLYRPLQEVNEAYLRSRTPYKPL